ncbi:hypothetical protein Ataiwa_07180 [Algoriphagus taiwanensis]|uniref:Pentapeptide repeat-containing protein n=1 Tax=Algoriphagus taiwanensis TaxID=1445656 RepID=A0ABQ6PXT8_9BACT|nr:hypothetical protein Ataiwa_07180 [Algoriphagus taiwanensis]
MSAYLGFTNYDLRTGNLDLNTFQVDISEANFQTPFLPYLLTSKLPCLSTQSFNR